MRKSFPGSNRVRTFTVRAISFDVVEVSTEIGKRGYLG